MAKPVNCSDCESNYLSGFGNTFSSEAIPDSLPKGQNNPQACPLGLYCEQLSGTAFTAPRHKNQRTWLYKIRPSVMHNLMHPVEHHGLIEPSSLVTNPNQMRWSPFDYPEAPVDFIDSLKCICGAGDPTMKSGLSIYVYTCNASMHNRAVYNSDGDFLIVPQEGNLTIKTEMGNIFLTPCEIAVIQRGIKFSVSLEEHGRSRGYVLEVYSGHFVIPDLGPIGANGLANPQDFLTPKAAYEDLTFENYGYTLLNKYGGKMFSCTMGHSPFDCVAWRGNYAPYKYDLRKFNTMNSVSFDHPDPSIYTVLTCPSLEAGTAVADFVIFPPRWMVAENTFRPPWFHRNCMSEYMGMIWGQYDAKAGGFVPGGGSLHLPMTAHGPDGATFDKHSDTSVPLTPHYFDAGLAFMFESTYIFKVNKAALESSAYQQDYAKCWQTLKHNFVAPAAATASEPHDEQASKRKKTTK